MGFFRRIEDYLQRPSANTIHFSEAEEALRKKQMEEEKDASKDTGEGSTDQKVDDKQPAAGDSGPESDGRGE